MARSTFRQDRLYVYTVDLYKPALDIDAGKSPSDLYYSLAYSGVKCLYMSTPEVDIPEAPGRTKEINIFTLDQWHFYQDQEIQDTWFIHLTAPATFAEADGWWAVQGNAQTRIGFRQRNPNFRQVYAKRGLRPAMAEDFPNG